MLDDSIVVIVSLLIMDPVIEPDMELVIDEFMDEEEAIDDVATTELTVTAMRPISPNIVTTRMIIVPVRI